MRRFVASSLCTALVAFGLAAAGVCGEPARTRRALTPDLTQQKWLGSAICYSGYRTSQSPKKEIYPTQAQVLEDLRIVARNFSLIRVYGSDRHSEDVLEVIRREKIPLKVMLGIWLDGRPGYEAENAGQFATGIRLANAYQDIVVAVSVGNEILVSWSDHKLTEDMTLDLVNKVKAAVSCPVTVADDFLYWSGADAKLAAVVDFIAMHTYPAWGKQDIDTALASTISTYERVRHAHPDKTVVITEAGWPTYTQGEQHVPRAGDEQKQKRYYGELTSWAKASGLTAFVFEAFDEPWKGEGTEGHWGLFTEGRKAKPVMVDLYPDLRPTGPTSPGYEEPATPAESQGR
jgi:exo-beta-1,3-glucanase (GH17 family)